MYTINKNKDNIQDSEVFMFNKMSVMLSVDESISIFQFCTERLVYNGHGVGLIQNWIDFLSIFWP